MELELDLLVDCIYLFISYLGSESVVVFLQRYYRFNNIREWHWWLISPLILFRNGASHHLFKVPTIWRAALDFMC